MQFKAPRSLRHSLALAALLASQLGFGTTTALAASAACTTINQIGTTSSYTNRWPATAFAPGEKVTVTSSDNGSQNNGVDITRSDLAMLSRYDFTNYWRHESYRSPAALVSKTTDDGFVETYGLYVMVKASTALAPVTLSCTPAVVAPTITLSPTTIRDGAYKLGYHQTLTASGGTAPYLWSNSGTLPNGVDLAASGELSGTPTQTGSFAFTATATDANGVSAAGNYTLVVNAVIPAAPSSVQATAGNAQAEVSFTPGDSGGAPVTYTVTSLPGGLTATGTGSPLTVSGLTNGTTYAFLVTANNGVGAATSAASNSVTPATAQVITFNPPGAHNYGTAPTLTATSSSGLPVSFASVSGAVCSITSAGTLSFHQAGTCAIQASQPGNAAYLPAASIQQSFTVRPVAPDAPLIGSASASSGAASISFTAPANTGGIALSSYTVTAAPGGRSATGATSPISVTGLDNGTAYTFTVTATQSAGTSAPSAATNTVTPIGEQTITFGPPGHRDFGTTSPLVATASSGLAVTLSSTTPQVCTVSGTSLSAIAPGTCSIVASQPGNPAFSAAVPVTQSFAIVVPGGAVTITPPVLEHGKAGSPYVATLGASGGAAPYVWTTSGLPTGLSLSPAGVISGTPTSVGSFALALGVRDAAGQSATTHATLVVGEPAPQAIADTASTGANAAVSIAVTDNDIGPISSIALAQAPAHGSAVVSGLRVVYTPATDYFGQDGLTYIATGPGGSSQPTAVSISIQAGAVPVPVADTRSETLLAGRRVHINAAEGAGNGPFTAVTIVTAPTSGTLEVNGTDLVYTADPQASGEVSFVYTISNAFGPSAPVRVALQVNPTPVAVAITETTVAGTTSTVDLTAAASGGPFTAATVVSVRPASAGTAAITRAASGYLLVFVAAEQYAGTAQVDYTLANAYTTSPASTVSFVVQGRTDPSKDAEVIGLLSAQADATRRMASGQISNVQRRLEQLRSGQPSAGFTNGIRLSAAHASRPADAMGDDALRAADAALPDAAAMPAAAPDAGPSSSTAIWTGGAINLGKAGTGHGDTSTDFTTSGLSIGADTWVADGVVIGAGAGYGHDATDVGNAGSRSKVDSYSAAVYASYQPTDALFADLLLGYQWLSLETIRHVTGTDRRVSGSREGTQWFGALSVGYQLRSDALQLTPYGRIEWARAGLDDYTEQGDAIHALSYQRQSVASSTASAGLLAQFTVKRGYGVWTPLLRAEYGRDLEGASEAFMRYADLANGTTYRATLQQRARHHALLGGGLNLQTLAGWRLSAEYQLQLDSDTRDNQTLRFGLEKSFDP